MEVAQLCAYLSFRRYNRNVTANETDPASNLYEATQLTETAITGDLDFSCASPVEADEEISGKLVIAKRNGDKIRADLACVRYLRRVKELKQFLPSGGYARKGHWRQ